MEAAKPICPGLGLNLRASTETVAYSEMTHQRDRQDGRQTDVKSLKDYAIRQIARFSHTNDKVAVLAYVKAGFDVTSPSVLDIPLIVHQRISRAITHFINIPERQSSQIIGPAFSVNKCCKRARISSHFFKFSPQKWRF
jgi:hypothetical protein